MREYPQVEVSNADNFNSVEIKTSILGALIIPTRVSKEAVSCDCKGSNRSFEGGNLRFLSK